MTYDEMHDAFLAQRYWVIEELQGGTTPRLFGPFTEEAANDFYEQHCATLRKDGHRYLLTIATDGRKIWS